LEEESLNGMWDVSWIGEKAAARRFSPGIGQIDRERAEKE